jgi:redox-sensitive bicupin YhaK (pirin superfamily)
VAISVTARLTAASLARDGLLNPEIFLTNWREASRISVSVAGGSKLNNGLMFRHMSLAPRNGRANMEYAIALSLRMWENGPWRLGILDRTARWKQSSHRSQFAVSAARRRGEKIDSRIALRASGSGVMPENVEAGRVVIRSSHEDLSEPTSHLLIPTAEQGPFPPFDRFAETVARARLRLGFHPHLAEEVVTYVLDGAVHHEDGSGRHTVLNAGSVFVVTAHQEIRHELTMQPLQDGRSARSLSIVLRLPWHTEAPPTSLQIKDAADAVESTDGTVQRSVVGPLARADSAMGLECVDLEFSRATETSFQIGRHRRGIAYVLEGSGTVDKGRVEPGQGALFENVARLTLSGSPGFRVFLASVPVADNTERAASGRARSTRA